MFTENRQALLKTNELATLARVNGESTTFPVIFDNQYAEEFEIEGSAPIIMADDDDLAANSVGHDISVDVKHPVSLTWNTYKVINVQPDDTGFSMLYLEDIVDP